MAYLVWPYVCLLYTSPLVNSGEYAKLTKIEELGQEDIPQAKVIDILLKDFKYMNDQARCVSETAFMVVLILLVEYLCWDGILYINF